MKTFPRVLCVAWVVACCVFGAPSHALEAGAAKVEIVSVPGAPLDGDFTRRGRPATGTRDPLFVRALFLQDGETSVFLVSADLFAITPDLRARVLEKAPGVTPRENIILAATHTLNGPGGLDHSWLGRQRGGRFMADEVDAVAAKFAEAMQTAYDRRTRASAGYASSDTTLVANRFDPAAKADGQLSLLRVDDSDGNPIVLVANIGAAPQGVDDLVFSSGFPGAFCTELEGMSASPVIAMFLNGASGDQVAAPTQGIQSFAEILAGRAKALVNEIKCREVTMAYSSATSVTPLHSARPFYSNVAVFQVLEIDRLAMMFMSPIPRGTVSLLLRSAASARGYAQSMVVAPANGYIGAVAPVETIALAAGGEPVYLGAEAEEWLVERAAAPLSRGGVADAGEHAVPREPKIDERKGVIHLAESGTAADIGAQRGAVLRQLNGEQALEALPGRWLEAAAGVLGHWQLLRSTVAVESLALPIAGEAARAMLGNMGNETIETLATLSSASEIPFTHLWLRQLAPSSDLPALVGPVGAAFSLVTRDNGIVIGQSLEWPSAVKPVVAQVKPKSGHSYVVAGFPWHIGGVAGVNDRGVAVAIATRRAGSDAAIAVPAEVILSEVLTHMASFDEAIAFLSVPRPDLAGRMLVACDDGNQSRSAIVELGVSPSVVLNLAATDIASDRLAPAVRDLRIQTLLGGLHDSTNADAERILADRDHRAAQEDRVLNSRTRACIVLVPRQREMRVMAPDAGTPRSFEVVSLRGGES